MRFQIVSSAEYMKLARHIVEQLPKMGPVSSHGYSECESLLIPDHYSNPESEMSTHESEQWPAPEANNYGT